jgi:CHAT domain-containing protein
LPYTAQEADEILRVSPDPSNLKAVSFHASRALATSGVLSQYRYVHFATHGYLDTENPSLSALVLSQLDEKRHPLDGFLRVNDIYDLKLSADLVVLSACQTGLGKEIRGEGLMGLTRAFLYAGSPRLIVSLWNVNDRATADLMADLYRGMLRRGLSASAALREAQLQMRRQKKWESPYYWAAFVQQGEWK